MDDDDALSAHCPSFLVNLYFPFKQCRPGATEVRINTAEDIHQCGLARTILPYQERGWFLFHLKIYIIQSANAGKELW